MQLLVIAANFQQFRAGRKPDAPEHKCEELNMKDTCPGAAPGEVLVCILSAHHALMTVLFQPVVN